MFHNSALQTVMLGTAALGFVAGCLGTFAVLRRQSLLGDAVSHAALPGVVLAFLLFGKLPLVLIVGAAVSGLVAMRAVTFITGNSRVPFDSALAGVLAVFFGAGLVLMRTSQSSGTAGIDRYLFGQAATLLSRDVWTIVGAGCVALATLIVFWKEFKLLTFDREYAAGQGMPVGLLDALLTCLIVLSIVIGLESVGVVLMSSLVVAPAAAARQWTNRLGTMVILSGLFGAFAGAFGTWVSNELSEPARKIATGPTIVLCATATVAVSFAWRAGTRRIRRRLGQAALRRADPPVVHE